MSYAPVECSWCCDPCDLSDHDEEGDPCCEGCATLAGIERVSVAAKRLFVSAPALRQAALAVGLVGNRQRPATWAAVARNMRRAKLATN